MKLILKKQIEAISRCGTLACAYNRRFSYVEFDYTRDAEECMLVNKRVKIAEGQRFPDFCPLENLKTHEVEGVIKNCGKYCPYYTPGDYEICKAAERIIKREERFGPHPDKPNLKNWEIGVFPKWCPLFEGEDSQ